MRISIALTALLLATASSAFAVEEVSVVDRPLHQSNYELSMMTFVRSTQGSFDPYGAYTSFPSGSSAFSLMTTLGGSYRLPWGFEVGGGIPFRQSFMNFPSGSTTSSSLGGVSAHLKFHAGTWAHLVPHIAAVTPWKWRATKTDGDPGASMPEDFGDGMSTAAFHAGIGASRSYKFIRGALDVTGMFPFAMWQTPMDGAPNSPAILVRSGNAIQLLEGIAFTLPKGFTINGNLRQMWADSTVVDGNSISGTKKRLFTTGVGLAYSPSPSWRFTGTFDTPWPFYAAAVNMPYSPSFGFMMAYVGI
ncbi:MAG: hypothetical protein ACXWPM_06090 [Bdellovibrionota bacterium]